MVEQTKTQCRGYPLEDFLPCAQHELREIKDALASSRIGPQSYQRGTITTDGRLDLCKQNLGPKGLDYLLPELVSNGYIHAVLLGTNGLGDAGAKRVATIVKQNNTLKTIYLGCNGITASGVAALGEALVTNHNINALWLKRNPLAMEGSHALATHLARGTELSTLDLVHTKINCDGLKAVLDSLVRGHTKLVRLFLGGNQFDSSIAQVLVQFIRKMPTLRELYLSVNQLTDDGVKEILGNGDLTQLTTLGLGSNGLTEDSLDSINNETLPNLQRLDLSDAPSTQLLGGLPNIFDDAAVQKLAKALRKWKRIEWVSLNNRGYSTIGAQTLLEAAMSSTSLKRLQVPFSSMNGVQQRLLKAFHGSRGAPHIPKEILQIKSVYR